MVWRYTGILIKRTGISNLQNDTAVYTDISVYRYILILS